MAPKDGASQSSDDLFKMPDDFPAPPPIPKIPPKIVSGYTSWWWDNLDAWQKSEELWAPMNYHVFLSHSRADFDAAYILAEQLVAAGLKVFLAPISLSQELLFEDQTSNRWSSSLETALISSMHFL